MSSKNLEERMQAAGGPVTLLRNSQSGPNPYPVELPEYTNWRDEQRAWQNTAVVFNQSYHMTDMYVTGPDALSCWRASASTASRASSRRQGQAVRALSL